MEPVTLSTATKGTVGLVTSGPVKTFLANKLSPIRAARKSARTFAQKGVKIKWLRLGCLLREENLWIDVAALEPTARRTLSDLIKNEDIIQPSGNDEQIDQLLNALAFDLLYFSDMGTSRIIQAKIATNNHHELLSSKNAEDPLEFAIKLFPPYRKDKAREVAAESKLLRNLVITLAKEGDRKSILDQWATSPPAGLEDASATAWGWLASLSADIGAKKSTLLTFVNKGIENGAQAAYWWARVGFMVGIGTKAQREEALKYWNQSDPKHPLASIGISLISHRFKDAETLLSAWLPEDPEEKSIKNLLELIAASSQGDTNRAIAIGRGFVQEYPHDSKNLISTAEALISRGYYEESDNRLNDFGEAKRLAIQARDCLRSWNGDSVSAILVAVQAAVLTNELDQAWKLTQAEPNGEALRNEASDHRLRSQSAQFAVLFEHFDDAEQIAIESNNQSLVHMVNGQKEYYEGNFDAAEDSFLKAWQLSVDDRFKIQVAYYLSRLGRELPDLSELNAQYGASIQRILLQHEIFSSDDPLAQLRLQRNSSPELAVLYAEQLYNLGQMQEAAEALESAGARWNHAHLMLMSAERFASIAEHEKAVEAASKAMSLGGPAWARHLDALEIRQFSLEQMEDFEEATLNARDMLSIAPTSKRLRWVLVHSLVREVRNKEAWKALTPEGDPLNPETQLQAKLWIALASEFDLSEKFLSRALDILSRWLDDPEVAGIFISEINRSLVTRNHELNDRDLRKLRDISQEFSSSFPDNHYFRAVSIDMEDPLSSLRAILERQRSNDPAVKQVAKRIEIGELPLGLATTISQDSYTETCLRGLGLVYSHSDALSGPGQLAAETALESRVVVDATAASTLSQLNPIDEKYLISKFSDLLTTLAAYRDSVAAKRKLSLKSDAYLHLDQERNQPVLINLDPEQSERLLERAHRVQTVFNQAKKTNWKSFQALTEFSDRTVWLSALDFATANGLPFWCDDRSLRELAIQQGAATFGTVDLISFLSSKSQISIVQVNRILGSLINAYHVDIPFDTETFKLAAEKDGWTARGVATSISRVNAWTDINAVSKFVFDAMARAAAVDTSLLEDWTTAIALGVIRIAGDNSELASTNLRFLLEKILGQPWLNSNEFPQVIRGIRIAMQEIDEVEDPLLPELQKLYQNLSRQYDSSSAGQVILMLVKCLEPKDRHAVTQMILTRDPFRTE